MPDAWHGRQHGSTRGQMQELPAGKFHVCPPRAALCSLRSCHHEALACLPA